MNILVLGGNGFIGSHLVKSLIYHGYNVKVLDKNEPSQYNKLNQVSYYTGDFNDTFLLSEALQKVNIVIHLISTTIPAISNLNPKKDIEENLLTTINLLEQMKRLNIKRIIFLSTGGAAYGNPKKIPVSETHPLNPISSYAIVKVTIEHYLYMYQHLYGIQPLIFRPSIVYGIGQSNFGIHGVISTFLNKIKNNQNLQIWGDGSAIKDYLNINDLVGIFIKAIKTNKTGIYNVGLGKSYTVLDIIDFIKKITGYDPKIEFQEKQTSDISKVVLNISKAERDFQWKPKIDLEQGIKQLWKMLVLNLFLIMI